ncbi:hypothetical protein I4U23_028672 [Adineta vaga]|nr:hypothetical protein I4U23_028672 [Adineta vaga]
MYTLHLIFFISILWTTNAQWFIKKSDRAKLAHYPNPGKRSLPEESSIYTTTDCSMPYSQLETYEQKATWIFLCGYKQSSSLESNENLFTPDLNNIDLELTSSANIHLPIKRSFHVVPPYFKEDDVSFKRLMRKLWRYSGDKK